MADFSHAPEPEEPVEEEEEESESESEPESELEAYVIDPSLPSYQLFDAPLDSDSDDEAADGDSDEPLTPQQLKAVLRATLITVFSNGSLKAVRDFGGYSRSIIERAAIALGEALHEQTLAALGQAPEVALGLAIIQGAGLVSYLTVRAVHAKPGGTRVCSFLGAQPVANRTKDALVAALRVLLEGAGGGLKDRVVAVAWELPRHWPEREQATHIRLAEGVAAEVARCQAAEPGKWRGDSLEQVWTADGTAEELGVLSPDWTAGTGLSGQSTELLTTLLRIRMCGTRDPRELPPATLERALAKLQAA